MSKILSAIMLAFALVLIAWTPMDGTPASAPDGTEAVWCVQPPVKATGNDKRCTAKQIAQTLFLFSLRMPTRLGAATDAWVAGTDYFLCKNVSGVATWPLPASPVNGDTYLAKDCFGDAATNNITVSGNGHNIDGAATNLINTAYGVRAYTFVAGAGMWAAN